MCERIPDALRSLMFCFVCDPVISAPIRPDNKTFYEYETIEAILRESEQVTTELKSGNHTETTPSARRKSQLEERGQS